MEDSFIHQTSAIVLVLMLVGVMIVFTILGQFIRNRQKTVIEELKGTLATLLGSLFALFGFILAFTFGMAGNRYESIKDILIDESNSIGTAVLRADLYADTVREELRGNFKRYLEGRIYYYDHFTDLEHGKKGVEESNEAMNKIWGRVMQQSKLPNMLVPSNQMVPALNNLIDTAAKRELIGKARLPDLLIYTLFLLSVVISSVIGYTIPSDAPKRWIIIGTFIIISCLIIYVILDFSRPMRGFVKADFGNEAIIQAYKDLKLEDVK